MKLTVSSTLNERVGAPKVNAPSNRVVMPGETIDVTDVIYGDVLNGNGIWYKTASSFYYWSGCFYETSFSLNVELDNFNEKQQLEILLLVKNQAKPELEKQILDYKGCGVGHKNTNFAKRLCLIVYVDKKIPDKQLGENVLLDKILFKGILIPTDVIEEPKASHHYKPNNAVNMEDDTPPLIGGGIQANGFTSTGTRSIVVKKLKNGKTSDYNYFLLTCYHVLLNDMISKGTKTYNGGSRSAKIPLKKHAPDCNIAEGRYDSYFDYAAVKLNSNIQVLNDIDSITIKSFYDFDEIASLKGRKVYTIGYESGKQEGKVLSIFNSIPLSPHYQTFDNVIFTEKLSIKGDSGAPVIDCLTNKLIGFIIGGNEIDKSYVLPFYNLNYKQNFNLNTL